MKHNRYIITSIIFSLCTLLLMAFPIKTSTEIVESKPITACTSAQAPEVVVSSVPDVKEKVETPSEVITEEHKTFYDYTEEELDLLARLICAEGGAESYETQLMIGSVVMNRVVDSHFPNTIREVIYQRNQFSVTFIKIDGVVMIDRPADEDAKKAAYEILNYGSILPQKVQCFFEKSVTDEWLCSREPYGTFDSTTFAYIYEREDK